MTNPDSAVTVIEQTPQAVVEWNLDNWPTNEFNRLVPTQTIGIANEFIRPVVAVVQLDLETDTYTSKDLKEGHRAPNAKGLAKLADAAGVSFVDEVRLDDGSDPMRAHVRVIAQMVDPTGMKRTATGARDYVLASQPMTDNQRARAKAFVYEHASTRARHRAMRLLLSLPQSYPIAELRKPFAVVRFLPNTQHPEVREIYKGALAANVTALFGPQQAPAQLPAGQHLSDDMLDDEAPVESARQLSPGRASAAPAAGADADSGAPGSAAPAASGAPEEPDWLRDAPAAAAPVSLADRIRSSAADEGAPKGAATRPQLDEIAKAFAALGEERRAVVAAGIRAIWGPDTSLDLTAAQARAIQLAIESLDGDFLVRWAEMAS